MTQTPLGILEFSDMKLETVPESESYFGFFPAKYVSNYLERYVASRVYNGKPLATRICLRSRVQTLVKIAEGWSLHVETQTHEQSHITQHKALKVIDATGLTSTPNIPSIPGQNSFRGLICHHKDFGRLQESLLSASGPRKIVVLGGAKSAADVAYAAATADKEVVWVIRRSGAGPAAFVSAKGQGMYNNSNESFYTRLTSYFLASLYLDESLTWFGRLLYRSRVGQLVMRRIWAGIDKKAHATADYDRSDGKKNGFHNLRPDTSIFWQNDSTGICQHDDFFDVIARRVKVYREDVKCFFETGLRLADDTTIDAEAIVFATGWKISHPKILASDGKTEIASSLGISVPNDSGRSAVSSYWTEIEKACRVAVLDRFPILRDMPAYFRPPSDDTTPLRLYKGMLPIGDDSITFLGQMMLGNHFRAAEVQALFAVAALDRTLKLPSKSEMKLSIAETISWCRLRYLSKGSHGNWLYWDLVPYTDNLLKELGLQSHLYANPLKNLWRTCFASDLRNLLQEYKKKHDIKDVG